MSYVLGSMSVTVRGDAVALDAPLAIDPGGAPLPGSRLRVITDRHSLRVCHLADALPYVYTNLHGELVGYDVAARHHLAIELGVRLEFIGVDRAAVLRPDTITTMLTNG